MGEELVPDHFLKNQNWAYLWIKFYCLIVFNSWDIGQYVYCNYLNYKYLGISIKANQGDPTLIYLVLKNVPSKFSYH